MAYNKGEDLQNKINNLSRTVLTVKIFKFIVFFYSFLAFFFWLLNCFELDDWLFTFSWLFKIPYKIVSIFYKPTGLGADFTLVIIGLVALIMGLICQFFSGNIYLKISDYQDEFEKYMEMKKRAVQRKKKPRPITTYTSESDFQQNTVVDENSVLIFIMQPYIHKIKNKPADNELTFQELDLWRQRVNKRILENIKYSQPLQKGYYRKNLFLVYKDFSYADDFIDYIKPTVASIVAEFKKYAIDVQFSYVLSSVGQLSGLEKELDMLDIILSLNFINIFILTSKFKMAYERKTIRKYDMILKGEYNLSKNLSTSNVQPLYILKEDKK